MNEWKKVSPTLHSVMQHFYSINELVTHSEISKLNMNFIPGMRLSAASDHFSICWIIEVSSRQPFLHDPIMQNIEFIKTQATYSHTCKQLSDKEWFSRNIWGVVAQW